jgi:hypothetical protein
LPYGAPTAFAIEARERRFPADNGNDRASIAMSEAFPVMSRQSNKKTLDGGLRH